MASAHTFDASSVPPALQNLLRKLERSHRLDEREAEAVIRLPVRIAEIGADQDIVREGDRPSRSFALLDGFVCAHKLTGDGKRQILALHLPGDMPDLQSLHLPVLDFSISAVTTCRVGFIEHEPLRQLCADHPRIASALWRETLMTAAITREWLLNVGQRNAAQRAAHLICETVLRMRAAGLAKGDSVEFPITQDEFASALGVSAVHANRVLQDLKSRGLVSWGRRTLEVEDWAGLVRFGDFDPTYLHLASEQTSTDGA